MKTKLLILMSLLLICSGLFVSCKDSADTTPQNSAFTDNREWIYYNDPWIESIDQEGGRTGPSVNRPLNAEQTEWINTAKSIMDNELGITDFEKDMDKTPTIYVHIENECQGKAYSDYFKDCQRAVDSYDNEKADCLRSVGYSASAISVFNGQLSWKAFANWLKGNKGGNARGFIYTIALANLAATECIESKLSNARSAVADANKEFAVRYARCK